MFSGLFLLVWISGLNGTVPPRSNNLDGFLLVLDEYSSSPICRHIIFCGGARSERGKRARAAACA